MYVTKANKRAMRQLIDEESFEYVTSLSQGLKTLQFGKGKIKGHVLLLEDLLFDPPSKPDHSADKRRKVFGLYQQPAKTEAATISGTVEKPTRFDAKTVCVEDVHGCFISGEDAISSWTRSPQHSPDGERRTRRGYRNKEKALSP